MNNFLIILFSPLLFLFLIYFELKLLYFPIDELIVYDNNKIIKYKYFPNLIYYIYSLCHNKYKYEIKYFEDNI